MENSETVEGMSFAAEQKFYATKTVWQCTTSYKYTHIYIYIIVYIHKIN